MCIFPSLNLIIIFAHFLLWCKQWLRELNGPFFFILPLEAISATATLQIEFGIAEIRDSGCMTNMMFLFVSSASVLLFSLLKLLPRNSAFLLLHDRFFQCISYCQFICTMQIFPALLHIIQASMKKIYSIPAKTSTVTTPYSMPLASCAGHVLCNASSLITSLSLIHRYYSTSVWATPVSQSMTHCLSVVVAWGRSDLELLDARSTSGWVSAALALLPARLIFFCLQQFLQ